MYIPIILFTLFAAWRWGDWKNWNKYNSTMLFISWGNLLYNYLYKNSLLWELKTYIINKTITELLNTIILLPFTVLLLLSNYPDRVGMQVYKISKYIAIYSAVEFVYYKLGLMVYNQGWNFWWSIAWNFMMFPMMVLHYKKPLFAYIAAIAAIVIILDLFPVKM